MSRLKRFAVGTGVTLVALGGLTGFWYKNHYVVPPEPARTVVLPSPNGFDTLQEATKLEVGELDGVTTSPSKDDPPASLEKRLALLEANKAAIEKTREALGQEFHQPVVKWPGTDIIKYAEVRAQARMLAFASRTYAEAGDTTEAMNCALDAIELGVKVPRGGMLIGNLVGLACETIGQKAAWELTDKLDSMTAKKAAERMARIRAERWPFENVLEEERIFARQGTRATYAGGPIAAWKGSGELLNSQLQAIDTVSSLAGEDTDKPTLAQRAQLLWLRAQVVYHGPKTTLENGDIWMKALQEQSKAPWNPNRPEPVAPTDPLNQIIAPVFSQATFKGVETDARAALLQAYLSLNSGNHGDLVHDSEPPTLPVDPFSSERAPLHFREDGGKFTLWSVGPDGKDDSGKPIDMGNKRGFVDSDKTGDIVARVNTW